MHYICMCFSAAWRVCSSNLCIHLFVHSFVYFYIFYLQLSIFIYGRFNGRTVILHVIISTHIEGLGALIRGAGGAGGEVGNGPGGGLEIRVSAPDGWLEIRVSAPARGVGRLE